MSMSRGRSRIGAARRGLETGALVAVLALCAAGSAPGRAAAFAKAIWGQPTYNGVDQFPIYRQLGVQIVQVELDWNQVAPTQPADPTNPADPAYQWPSTIQQMVAEAPAYHMRILLQIINAPPWADGGHAGPGWAPTSAAPFVQFAQAAAREYPNVHLWMIWGEPTKAGNFMPLSQALPGQLLDRAQRHMAQLYAEMLDGAYGALKRISRSNLVIGGCTYSTGAIDTLQWISNLRLPSGRPPRMDMYAHNPFSYESPVFRRLPSAFDEVQFADLHELAAWIDRYLKPRLPIFLSEWTIPTQPDNTFNFWVEPDVAARWVTEALRECRAWHRIYGLGWINVYDNLPLISGGLLTATGTPKPDFYAFARG